MKRAHRLDQLRIVTPCSVPWSSMEGDDRVRFCGRCRKSVYNVAAMGRAEALALIERAEGRVCMQLTRRADGTIVTGDCWAALRRARRRGLLAFAAALPVVLLMQLWSQAFGLRALGGLFHRDPPAPVASPPVARGLTTPAPPPTFGPVKGEVAIQPPKQKGTKVPRHIPEPNPRMLGGAVMLAE
jgi:hypothetical protein